jgi:hypothetical protein
MAELRGRSGRAVTTPPAGWTPESRPPDDSWELGARVIRPYILTGGRTRPAAPPLAIEAMLESSDEGLAWASELLPEQRQVVALCTQPVSVAEVASRLAAPLGVICVLVAEMVDADWLHVYEPDADLAADVELLQRLIARVKAIPA